MAVTARGARFSAAPQADRSSAIQGAAAIAGCRFWRNDEPLGWYRRRDDSLSSSELRMLRGILRVYQKLRAQLLDRPADVAILDAQLTRFESERLAAEAGISDPESFARQWHILMKGAIVAAAEGDREAARRAQSVGALLLSEAAA